jgi:hypothetical protein
MSGRKIIIRKKASRTGAIRSEAFLIAAQTITTPASVNTMAATGVDDRCSTL